MKIGFVGAGKVGFTLGKYFKDHGADVTGYYSRSAESAKEAACFTETKYFGSLDQIISECDTIFLTVPDTAIKSVWDSLKMMPVENKVVCHCSGALSSDVFEGIDLVQAYGYSVHPFYAISSKLASFEVMSQAFFTLEGDAKYLQDLKRFFEQMGNPVHIIDKNKKVKYHAAAVFLSNNVTALAYVGCKILKECGFENEITSIALKTLFIGNCGAIAEKGIVKALTGPVERNDLPTVKKHLDCLDGNEKLLYTYLSAQLIEIAKEKHSEYDYSAMDSLINSIMEAL